MKRYVDADEALGRIIRNTVPNGDCLEWQGQYIEWDESTRRGGYGLAHVPTHLGYDLPEKTTVHRIVHAYVTGDTPPTVMHTCDNRKCVNPTHLESGTHQDNTQDMLTKRRGRWDNFSPDDISHIRATNVPGRGGNTRELAEAYGVAMGTIRRIATGAGWVNVK